MGTLCLCLLLQLCAVRSQESVLDSPFFLNSYHQVRNWISQTFGRDLTRTYTGPSGKVQKEVPLNVRFPCNVTGGRSPKVPDSVHRLRPGDIDVVAAIGDSLTAGFGALSINFFQSLLENRGVSGNIGGEATWRQYTTLPNILKEFNPNLTGYAYGDSYITDPGSRLNVASIAAMSKDMPFMANYLINRMKNDPKIDMKRHWKLISLFVGNNDFCSEICVLPSSRSIVEMHKNDLIKTLRILRNNLPRTFVAIQSIPHLEIVNEVEEGRFSFFIYIIKNLYCSCLFSERYKDRRPEYYDMISRWYKVEDEISEYPEFHRNDFTVVVLPIAKNLNIPRDADGLIDLSYFSADRLHASQKSHARFGSGLWNNLLEPIGNKTDRFTPLFEKFLCPTAEKPFLATRENSQLRNEPRG